SRTILATTTTTRQAMDDEYAISVAKSDYRDAYNAGDPDGVCRVFAEGFANMTDGHPSFWDVEAQVSLRHRLQRMFEKYEVRATVTIIDISIYGDFAFDSGWESFTLTPKSGGEPKTERYRYFETWSKDPKGNWKITGFINNRDLPPAMPTA